MMPPSAAANPLRRYLHGKGTKAPYALITGATGGMGAEWAYQLAAHGFNVVLQGRNRAKLEEARQTIVARQVKEGAKKRRRTSSTAGSSKAKATTAAAAAKAPKGSSVKRRKSTSSINVTKDDDPLGSNTVLPVPAHVEVELLVCEATVWPNEGLNDGLDALLSRKDVRLTVVINNLGVQSEGYPRLEDLSQDELSGIVVANSLFPAEIARRTLPYLKKESPSLLVTVTSIGAWTPTP